MKQNSKTEFDKMKSGELFNPADKSFLFPLAKAEYYQRRLNKAALWSQKRKERIIKKLVGSIDGNPYNIFIPFRVVFGSNIHIGKNFYAKKGKIKAEEKIGIVQACVEEKLSQAEAASRAGVDEASVRDWLVRYRSEGSLGFVEQNQRAYSAELKLQAVTDYLSGGLSQRKICEKYHIRSNRQLRNWIKVYNSGEDFNKHKMSGGSRMKKTRKTTQEERIEIAKDCIANGNNYGETALKYQVSYQQVYTWVKKFSELGEAGLEDRRGQRTAQQEPRTEEEKLRVEIAQLKHELYMTRMERDLLKKLEEVERRDAYRK